jgi:hypothetical protein
MSNRTHAHALASANLFVDELLPNRASAQYQVHWFMPLFFARQNSTRLERALWTCMHAMSFKSTGCIAQQLIVLPTT